MANLSSSAQWRGIVCISFVYIGIGNSLFHRGILLKSKKVRASNYIDIDGNKQHINDQYCLQVACQIEDLVWLGQERSDNSEKSMANQTVTVEIPKTSSTMKGVVLRSTFDSVPGIQMHIYQYSHDL